MPSRHAPYGQPTAVQIRSRRICHMGVAVTEGTDKPNKKPRQRRGSLYLVLDDDLLSHGETPHYHRRCIVSLLSSGWDQVVPMLYGRQAIRCYVVFSLHGVKGWVCDRNVFFIAVTAIPIQVRIVVNRCHDHTKLLGCYMVKPHGQLVLVSSTPCNAYTPSLSTS